MPVGSGREAIRLYRAILRRADSLQYTDKDFLKRLVRQEFKRWSRETKPADISRHLEVSDNELDAFSLLVTLIFFYPSESAVFPEFRLGRDAMSYRETINNSISLQL